MTPRFRATFGALLCAAASLAPSEAHAAGEMPVRVGSKRFTESYILAEMAVALAASAGNTETKHEQGLGGTALVFRALEEGAIDIYPEYTGTIVEAILHSQGPSDVASLRRALAEKRIGITEPLGFDNTYALAATAALAAKKGLSRISDLASDPTLRIGVSPEFFGRSDGFPGLSKRYGLSSANVQSLDHGLAYEAIRQGSIDVMDVYSTDAKIKRFDLKVLEDDKRFFPSYQAVFLYRDDLPTRAPAAFAAIGRLAGRIDAATMIDLNAQAELDGRAFDAVARDFVHGRLDVKPDGSGPRGDGRRTLIAGVMDTIRTEGPRHVGLVGVALAFATLIGVPLGILATRKRVLGRALLTTAGIVQTIPSLALLCFFIPLLGTGTLPALVALFLYGLLPIARNTAAGIEGIAPSLLESADALGLSPRAQLYSIHLPLASRTILAGIRTSAIINVGTATLAAFIGAGGFGAPISVGLNLNDTSMILAGAIPAAGLSLLVEGLFTVLDRVLIPKGLRV